MADWNRIKENEVKFAIEQAEKRARRDVDIIKWLHEHLKDERADVRLMANRYDAKRIALLDVYHEIQKKIDALYDDIESCEIKLATQAD